MLNVIAFPSFSPLFDSPSQLTYNYGYDSDTVRERHHYSVLFVAAEPVPLSSKRVRGYFNEGKLRSWSDRSCFHVKYDGNIIVDQNLQTAVPRGTMYFNCKAEYTPTGELYAAIIAPGQPFMSHYTHYVKRKKVTSTKYMYAYMTEDHMFYGSLDLLNGAKKGTIWWYYRRYDKTSGKAASFQSRSINFSTPDQLYAGCEFTSAVPALQAPKRRLRGGTLAEVDSQLRILNRLLVGEALHRIDIDEDAIYGELAMEAINSIRFVDTNSLQFLLDLTSAKSMFTSLIPKSASAKDLGQAYLSKKYGADNTLSDVEGYLRGAQRQLKAISPNTTRAARAARTFALDSNGSAEFHYKVIYGYYPSLALNIMRKLDEWALLPNATIAWDIIPLSFVCDWFTDVGSILEKVDFRTRYQMYDIIGVTRSCKINTRIVDSRSWSGFALSDVTVVRYNRQTMNKLDLPKFGYTPPQSFRNIAELTALLVANTGHKK